MRQQAANEQRELSRSAITILLSGTTPGGWGHEWFGAYAHRPGSVVNQRFTYVHEADESKTLWFDARSGRWCVGTHEAYEAQYHPNKAILAVVDSSLAPERISAPWMLRTDAESEAWVAAPTVRSVAADGADGDHLRMTTSRELGRAVPVVYLVGITPGTMPPGWMGEYELDRALVGPHKRHTYRRKLGPTKRLCYHRKTGDWRVERDEGGLITTVLSVYDGALMPELITTPWRAYSKDVGWQDAPGVSCKGGLEGKMAFDADQSVEAVQRSLTAGWLFPVRAEAVVEKLKMARGAGVHPSRLHVVLSRARATVESSIIQAGLAQLGPNIERPSARPRLPMPVGQSWRELAGLANRTARARRWE